MNNQVNEAQIIEALKEENAYLRGQIAELTAKVEWFMEQFKLAKHRQFGSSSEKTPQEQPSLFNEVEKETDLKVEEPTLETITYKRKKQKGHREEILEDLPVETIDYTLSSEDRVCPQCGGPLHEMSTEVRQELKIIPAKVKVVKHVRHVYACRRCDKEGINTPVITAKAPNPVIKGSLASPSSLAHIMNSKYTDGLPLYRQEQQWSRLGVKLSRQTMANWVVKSSELWLKPLYQRLREHLLKRDILMADETTLQVLHEEGRDARSKSFMWLYRTGRDGPPIVLFDYKTTRGGKNPKGFLKGFKGYLQVDGYQGYEQVPDVILVGCWAHARRKFDEALKVLPQDKKQSPSVALEGLMYCNRLFDIERDLRDCTQGERYKARLLRSKPLLDEFAAWLHKQSNNVLPKSRLGMAITYCQNQWRNLETFLQDGRLEIDNNRSERSIKPFVIGRKSWLFSNTPKGATASAMAYSIVETAKENDLIPYEYLEYLFERLPNLADDTGLEELMPWSDSIPERCRMGKAT